MKIQEFFRHFVRIHYKGIQLSNADLDATALDFENYLFDKVGKEKAKSWYPISLTKLILQADHPLMMNGYEPALTLHFCNYVEEGAKRHGEKRKEPVQEKVKKVDTNGKPLRLGDKVHPVGRGDRIMYIVEIGDEFAGINSDKSAITGNGVRYDKLVKFKNQD